MVSKTQRAERFSAALAWTLIALENHKNRHFAIGLVESRSLLITEWDGDS